jgi:hypothetical protein
MNPQPAFISVGENYFATIKRDGVETVLKEDGKIKPFDSSTRAMAAAIKAVASISKQIQIASPPPMSHEPQPEAVLRWRKDRLEQRQADRDYATLMGVEVIHKRRREIRK